MKNNPVAITNIVIKVALRFTIRKKNLNIFLSITSKDARTIGDSKEFLHRGCKFARFLFQIKIKNWKYSI